MAKDSVKRDNREEKRQFERLSKFGLIKAPSKGKKCIRFNEETGEKIIGADAIFGLTHSVDSVCIIDGQKWYMTLKYTNSNGGVQRYAAEDVYHFLIALKKGGYKGIAVLNGDQYTIHRGKDLKELESDSIKVLIGDDEQNSFFSSVTK